VLMMQQEPAFAREALGGGALGYVLKEAADEELVDAVRRAGGGAELPEPAAGRPHRLRAPAGPRDDLSEREVDVLRLIALVRRGLAIGGAALRCRACQSCPQRRSQPAR
jgi:two-component system response regulator NreC